MKKKLSFKYALITVCLFASLNTVAQKSKVTAKPTLDNKKYKVLFYEMKAAGRGKSQEGEITFTLGKLNCDFANEKLKIESSRYNIVLDSTYTEDDSQMHMFKVESFVENKTDETVWEMTIINGDIDGTVLQKKGGLDKKKFEFSGAEKQKK